MEQNRRDQRFSSYDDDREQNQRRQGRQDDNQQNGNQGNYGDEGYNRSNDSRQSHSSGYRNEQDRGNDWNNYGNQHNQGSANSGRRSQEEYGGNYRNRQNDDQQGNNSNYGSMNRGGNQGGYNSQNRDWIDRTRDEVSSWFGDSEAEHRRNNDAQKSGEHRGKGPKQYQRSQERIREDVCDRLSDDAHVDASNIEVKVNGTEVVLTGSVDSKQAKRRAEDIVESVSGVQNVHNQLRVGQQTSSSSQPASSTAANAGKTERSNS